MIASPSRLLRRAIVVGVAVGSMSCLSMIQHDIERDARRHFEDNERACATGVAEACVDAGSLYENGGHGVMPDPRTAANRYLRACDLKNERGCRSAHYLAEKAVKFDPALGIRLLDMPCRAGQLDACAELARWYEQGKGGLPKDEQRIRALYWDICRSASKLDDNSPSDRYWVVLNACETLALAATNGGFIYPYSGQPDKVLAAKLAIVVAELQLETNEAQWAMEDQSAKSIAEAQQAAEESRQAAAEAEAEARAERASRPDTFTQILGALSAGLSQAQQTTMRQRSLAGSTPPARIAHPGQHKTSHYVPAPPTQIAPAAKKHPYVVVPTPEAPRPAPKQCIAYRAQGCTLSTDCCDSGAICGSGPDGVNRCCAPPGTNAYSEYVYCCNGTISNPKDRYDIRCK